MRGWLPVYICPSRDCWRGARVTAERCFGGGLALRCENGHTWNPRALLVQNELFGHWLDGVGPPVDKQPAPEPRYEVRRGPAPGRWSFAAPVQSRDVAEKVVARWRREHPTEIAAIFADGTQLRG